VSLSKAARDKLLGPPPGAAEPPSRENGARQSHAHAHAGARSGLPADAPTTGEDEWITCWSPEEEAAATGLFQILDEEGRADPLRVPKLSLAELRQIYTGMLRSRLLDQRLLPLQRQGRIGFYIGATGQEAGVIAGAHALSPEDWFVPGLRETSAGLYRGMPLATHVAQMFGNANDVTGGRQMPCHSGTRQSHHIVMSSCVSSQLPHATGLAMAARLRGDKVVTLGYCGDGGTSEEDFHVGLNFAAVFKVPVVFVCQNNQWAISTPLSLQTASPTIAQKGLAYGLPSRRVDGNDIFAMYVAIKEAVDRARAGGGPAFIEALTYRLGAHSSSDDPTRYRSDDEPAEWRKKDPLERFRKWLFAQGIYTPESEAALAAAIEAEIREVVAVQEAAPPPPLTSLIGDVYAQPTWNLREQMADLERVRNKG
jgi:pyruvate dehydrogenase E1 component alpha subunit/2-oxoisovalerate dehydrogenase E1 component alpha subunit